MTWRMMGMKKSTSSSGSVHEPQQSLKIDEEGEQERMEENNRNGHDERREEEEERREEEEERKEKCVECGTEDSILFYETYILEGSERRRIVLCCTCVSTILTQVDPIQSYLRLDDE